MSEHTPGPWIVNGPSDALWVSTSDYRTILPHTTADARLMADAPRLYDENKRLRETNAELLEALKRVKETRVFIGAIAQGMMDNAIARAAPEVQP